MELELRLDRRLERAAGSRRVHGGGATVPWKAQLRSLLPVMALTYIPALGLLLMVGLIRVFEGTRMTYFTADPAATMGEPPYIGIVSNIGILIWATAAAVCFFVFTTLARAGANGGGLAAFFLASALLTMLLLLDDFFMLNSTLIGSSALATKETVLAAYMLLGVAYLVRFAGVIRGTDYLPLLLALGFFAVSRIVDLFPDRYSGHQLLEEGAKLLGIISWCIYFFWTGLKILERTRGRTAWR